MPSTCSDLDLRSSHSRAGTDGCFANGDSILPRPPEASSPVGYEACGRASRHGAVDRLEKRSWEEYRSSRPEFFARSVHHWRFLLKILGMISESDPGTTAVPTLPSTADGNGSAGGSNLRLCQVVKERSIRDFDLGAVKTFERVIVTGGAGEVGSALLTQLRDGGARQLVSYSKGGPANRRVRGVEYQNGRLDDPEAFERLLSRIEPDLVVHLAAERDPGRAERSVRNTVLTNVIGSDVVLEAVLRADIPNFVAASTGKAMRLYTSDVYASTKQILEYQASRASLRKNTSVGCARFTHLLGNSIIMRRIFKWAKDDEPINLHGANVDLFVQSTQEAAQLLLLTADLVRAQRSSPWLTAIRDLGWPPISLLDLAEDIRHETRSKSDINFVGFPRGYEESPYAGTTDPLTAGEHSPLLNAIECAQTSNPPGITPSVDVVAMPAPSGDVDHALRNLFITVYDSDTEAIRAALRETSRLNLARRLREAPMSVLERILRRGSAQSLFSLDHKVAHEMVMAAIATKATNFELTNTVHACDTGLAS